MVTLALGSHPWPHGPLTPLLDDALALSKPGAAAVRKPADAAAVPSSAAIKKRLQIVTQIAW